MSGQYLKEFNEIANEEKTLPKHFISSDGLESQRLDVIPATVN